MVVQSVEGNNVEECKKEAIFQLIKPTVSMRSKSLLPPCLQSLDMEHLPYLRLMKTLKIEQCPGMKVLLKDESAEAYKNCSGSECVINGNNKEIAQGDAKEMLPKLNIIHLEKLSSLIIIHREIKLQCELCHVQDCPKLKQTLADDLKPEDFLQDYESPESYFLSSHAALTYSKKGKGVATATSTIQVDNPNGVSTSNLYEAFVKYPHL